MKKQKNETKKYEIADIINLLSTNEITDDNIDIFIEKFNAVFIYNEKLIKKYDNYVRIYEIEIYKNIEKILSYGDINLVLKLSKNIDKILNDIDIIKNNKASKIFIKNIVNFQYVLKLKDNKKLQQDYYVDVEALNNMVKDANGDITVIKSKQNELEEWYKKNQFDIISIITLFCTVIMAVSASISFSGKVFENLVSFDIKKFMPIASLLGFIIYNFLYVIAYNIMRLSKKDIEFLSSFYIFIDLVLVGLVFYFYVNMGG